MKRSLLVTALLAITISGSHAQDIHSRIDSLMNYYYNEYNYNGVVLVTRDDSIVFHGAYGYRDIANKKKHDDNSIFQVGTITSQLTAEVIFQLAAEKKLNLDDTLNKYFPKFPSADSITIRNLLTNTSGIFDYFHYEEYFRKHDTLHVPKDSIMALFDKRKPSGKAGTHFQYSNSNYVLLGYIIEKVTKKSYSQVVRERIFKPAGMIHSGFDYRGLKDNNKSKGYRSYHENEEVLPSLDSTLTGAAASLYTTAYDLYAWHKALQSYKLLPKKMQDSMYVPLLRKYAYGCYVDTVYDKIALILGSEVQGYSSDIFRIPSDGLCIILLQNINHPAYDENSVARKIAGAFYDPAFSVPAPIPIISLSATQLEKYQGTYIPPAGVSMVITVDGNNLHVHNIPLKGMGGKIDDFDLSPIAINKFKTKSLNAIVEFTADGSGNVTGLILHNIRHDIIAKKQPDK